MKTVKFIKENDLFGWKIGDVIRVEDDGCLCCYGQGSIEAGDSHGNIIGRHLTGDWGEVWVDIKTFIDKGYAKFVDSDDSVLSDKDLEKLFVEYWKSKGYFYGVVSGSITRLDNKYGTITQPTSIQELEMYKHILGQYCKQRDIEYEIKVNDDEVLSVLFKKDGVALDLNNVHCDRLLGLIELIRFAS